MSEEVVVDIQGQVDSDGKFFGKEISILSLDGDYSSHHIICAPCSFKDLSPSAKRINNWLKRNCNRLDWEDGEVPYGCVPLLLLKATANAGAVYVRGREKASYLSEIISTPVINLEALSPPFRKLPREEKWCLFHGSVTCELYSCAVQNAHKLKTWILKEKANNTFDSDRFLCNNICVRDIQRIREIVEIDVSSEDEEDEGIDEIDFEGTTLTDAQFNALYKAAMGERLI